MKEIIITGHSGFVGKNLCPYLEKYDFKLVNLSLRKSYRLDDFTNKNTYAIIHLAGLAHDLKNANNEEDYFRVNTDLTIELYEQFLNSKVEKFIYFSSVKAAADSLGNKELTEDYEANPITAYGQSKKKAEEFILNKNSSKKYYILRPSMIHGPNNKGNLNLLYKMISKGIPYPFGAFENERSFLSVDNLNFILKEILLNDIDSGVYNVCDTENLSTVDLINAISEVQGRKSNILRLNKKFINFVAKIGDLIPFPFNSEKLKKLTENYKVSNKKIINAIGQKLPLTAKEGLIVTLKSFNIKK
jgi:nucleoside-diphosphate-sugar epimerase